MKYTDKTSADDYYDDVVDDENSWRKLERLQEKAIAQKSEELVYNEYNEVEKTMDLKFINGILHQYYITRIYKMEINSGESVLLGTITSWEKVANE